MPHLTDTLVKNLPIPTTKKALTPDGDTKREKGLRRFFAQVTRDGCRSFVIRYSINRRERLFTIGRWPDWPIAAARDEARRLLQLVDQGIDPLEQRIDNREAPTVHDLARRFLEEHVPTKRPSYLRNNRLLLERWILPAIGYLKVAETRPSHVDALFRKITKSGAPIVANRMVACGSKMFSLAERWGMREPGTNPFRGAVDRNNEIRRQVYLTPEQLVRISEQLGQLSQQPQDAIRLIMLTGCRRGEALAARVDQIDIAARVWRKPASSTKQNKPHEVHLSAPAVELLSRLVTEARVAGREYLFPGPDGHGHVKDIKKSWATLCRLCGLTGIRLHDLRHTFASIAVSRGATLPLVGAVLGHSSAQTTLRYSHLYDDPQRALAESVAAVITGNGGGEVVPLRRRP
jgi:integrase